jgi:PadR family transcriptional regulator PadR
MNDSDPFRSVRRGLLELAVLTSLDHHRRYAADIVSALADTPFATGEGTLYPLLGKLRRDGMLEHEWEESTSGPPRKYHALTSEGRERLTQLRSYMNELSTALDQLGADQ